MFDAGALIAIDRGERKMLALLEASRRSSVSITVTAPVIAQAWREGRRQARLAAFLKQPTIEVIAFSHIDARAVGELAAISRHADVVDLHLALLARRRGQVIVTSDPEDIRRIDPGARIIVV